jgi:hypothetical protein
VQPEVADDGCGTAACCGSAPPAGHRRRMPVHRFAALTRMLLRCDPSWV